MATASVGKWGERATRGGGKRVQLGEKGASSKTFYDTALRGRDSCRRQGVPLIINDGVDVALAVDADGVHIGQEDIPADVVRRLIGPDKILGVSASSFAEAIAAVDSGADYLGVGAMNATNTKTDAHLTSLLELSKIRAKVKLPIVVIGGIGLGNAYGFAQMGIDGLAVVSAIVAQKDIVAAARDIKAEFVRGLPKK